MAHAVTAPHSPTHRSTCNRCGAIVWVYGTQSGATVALDASPGEFIVDGRDHAYRSMGEQGYSQHACQGASGTKEARQADTLVAPSVQLDEFLWP
jgi:hypothetical protein